MHSQVMAENVIQISEAEGASDFASLPARVRRRCGARVRSALEQHLQDVVVVPYDLELSREYGKVKASLAPGTIVAAGIPFHCSHIPQTLRWDSAMEGRQRRDQFP
jgi:hypothetical protein